MEGDRCQRCQIRHQLQDCRLPRSKIKQTRFWADIRDAETKEVKEEEFMARYPANVKEAALPNPLDPASTRASAHTKPTASDSTQPRPQQSPALPVSQLNQLKLDLQQSTLGMNPPEPRSTQPINSQAISERSSSIPHSSPSAQITQHPRSTSKLRKAPNHLGFPAPVIRLPAIKRAAPSASGPAQNTYPLHAVPADSNMSKNPPQEYVEANNLRTEYGTSGRPTRVISNYAAVNKVPTKLFVYSVSLNLVDKGEKLITQELSRRSERRRVFESLKKVQPLTSRNDWATDFARIWSVKELFPRHEYSIADLEYTKSNGRSETIPQVTLSFDHKLNLGRSHLDLVAGGRDEGGTDAEGKARALNAIVSNFMCRSTSTPIQQFGANRFFLTDAYEDMGPDCPFITLRGYFSSIRPGNGQMLLNINTTTSAFFKPMVVSEFCQIMRGHGMKDWAIMGMLKKKVVRITCDRLVADLNQEERRKKTVRGFGAPPSRQTFFIGGDDPGKEQWIPAEFLEIDFPQPYNAVLPPAFTDRMMQVALRGPAANANMIVNEGLVRLGIKRDAATSHSDSSKTLRQNEIGTDIDDKLINIPARILRQPNLRYSAVNGQSQLVEPRFASWNLVDRQMRKQPFSASSTLPRIGILALGHSKINPRDLASRFVRILSAHNIRVTNLQQPWCKAIFPQADQEGSYVTSMRNVIGEVDGEMRENGVTMVLLPPKHDDMYCALKTVCDARGILTVCSVSPQHKLNDQTLSNIALKFSLKTGGRPHQVEGVLSAAGTDTMIMGADVSHPSASAKPHCPSIAAAVGSFDEHALNYSGSMRLQKSCQEIITDMEEMARELLQNYGKKNNKLPSNIVFYRDGVSESQYDQVRKEEVGAIEKAWVALKNQGKPSNASKVKITSMVVGKRHHTRFYPMKPGDMDRSENVVPGLVVDSVITHPHCFDFFLQSHAAIKGTARSAHYFLLRNDIKLNSQQLQDMTHALCYAYGTATKGISYCAPAYHADQLCERGRCYIRDWLLGRPNLSSMIRPYNRASVVTIQEHEQREARRLTTSRPYNIWETAQNGVFKGRKNPWHPNLDDKMFWV